MKKYTEEFKNDVLKKYMEGQTIASLSREMGVHENILRRWKKKLVVDENGEMDREKLRLLKENRELREENEILKKFAAIFARGS